MFVEVDVEASGIQRPEVGGHPGCVWLNLDSAPAHRGHVAQDRLGELQPRVAGVGAEHELAQVGSAGGVDRLGGVNRAELEGDTDREVEDRVHAGGRGGRLLHHLAHALRGDQTHHVALERTRLAVLGRGIEDVRRNAAPAGLAHLLAVYTDARAGAQGTSQQRRHRESLLSIVWWTNSPALCAILAEANARQQV